MDVSGVNAANKESRLHFEGDVHVLLPALPFCLLVRARSRQISHRELIADLDYLEHDFMFASTDLIELFPIGETVNLQLSNESDTIYVVATAEILERQIQPHSMQLRFGFKRVDEELEDLLSELKGTGYRSSANVH
jgi:hypothetical protein